MNSKKPKGASQSKRLLDYLWINKTATTIECRDELSIMGPAQRVNELRAQGWPIAKNNYQQLDASGRSHRAAQYYLQVEKLTPEQLNILI